MRKCGRMRREERLALLTICRRNLNFNQVFLTVLPFTITESLFRSMWKR